MPNGQSTNPKDIRKSHSFKLAPIGRPFPNQSLPCSLASTHADPVIFMSPCSTHPRALARYTTTDFGEAPTIVFEELNRCYFPTRPTALAYSSTGVTLAVPILIIGLKYFTTDS